MLLKGLEQITPKKQQEGENKTLSAEKKAKEDSKVSPFQEIADRIKEKKKQQRKQKLQVSIKNKPKQAELAR